MSPKRPTSPCLFCSHLGALGNRAGSKTRTGRWCASAVAFFGGRIFPRVWLKTQMGGRTTSRLLMRATSKGWNKSGCRTDTRVSKLQTHKPSSEALGSGGSGEHGWEQGWGQNKHKSQQASSPQADSSSLWLPATLRGLLAKGSEMATQQALAPAGPLGDIWWLASHRPEQHAW